MLAAGADLYTSDRVGIWQLSDRWLLAPDGSLGGIRTAERTVPPFSYGIDVFEYIRLEGRWWIDDGNLCLDSNVAGRHCYRVSPGGGGDTPDRFTGVETGSGRAIPMFIYPWRGD